MQNSTTPPCIAIACGGTGGHFFPGITVADRLAARGCRVTLIVSPKDVDQHAVSGVRGMDVLTLPAVGFSLRNLPGFARGFWTSYRAARLHFAANRPRAVLAMGGFTSAPPVLAAKRLGAAVFLHESNSIPGRANRLLSRWANEVFVGFPCAARHLMTEKITVTGTPVRPVFEPHETRSCRQALGLAAGDPVLLVMGGSQGASGVNKLMLDALPILHAAAPKLQFLHLAGPTEIQKVRQAYQQTSVRAVVRPFLSEMELALGAATVAVSRAGASSLAELAAMRLPAVLIPYPFAADNHQQVNAREFEQAGAAHMLIQNHTTGEELAAAVLGLLRNPTRRATMQEALAGWHRPDAGERIADRILAVAGIEARLQPVSGADASTRRPRQNLAPA